LAYLCGMLEDHRCLRQLNKEGTLTCQDLVRGTDSREDPAREKSVGDRTLAPHLSTGVNVQESAGTRQPIWAMMVIKQVCLRRVDLPPMFGPLTNISRGRNSGSGISSSACDARTGSCRRPPRDRSLAMNWVSPLRKGDENGAD
jgi:hypothetical protein